MKGISKIGWIVLCSFLWVGCSDHEGKEVTEEFDQPVSTETAILAYFVANNNLEDAIRKNVTTLCQGLLKMEKSATLLIYWDGRCSVSNSFWKEPCILKYVTDGKGHLNGRSMAYSPDELTQLHDVWGEPIYYASDTLTWEMAKVLPTQYTESTDSSALTGILNEMFAEVPHATRLGLILGSHGSGWLKYLDGRNSRSFGQDGPLSHTLTTPVMAQALARTGKHFDFVLFDACMMACAEVCYDFRKVTDYMIASVQDIPSPGFPYNQVAGDLCTFTPEGYRQACAKYIQYYEALNRSSGGWWGTMSLVDCREMDRLAQAVSQHLTESPQLQADYNPCHLQQYGGERSAFRYLSFDVHSFIQELAGEQASDFTEQLNRTVLYKGCVSNTSSHSVYRINPALYSGLGMYIPVSFKDGWNPYFKTLAWYSSAGWNRTYAEWVP